MTTRPAPPRLLAAAAVVWMGLPAGAAAFQRERTAPPDTAPEPPAAVYLLDGLNVTATRTVRPVFSTPAPVAVLDRVRIRREAPANLSDLFRGVPGLDAEGVGPGQRRPVIRGMRGQRVLLLEDGLRLNNARRRLDSGEPTSLVWASSVERVEVVRGPASVLYGSDAVGGVVNLVTRSGRLGSPGVGGFLEAGHRSAGGSQTLSGEVRARRGAFELRVSGGFRDAGAYTAPGGTFGDLSLDGPQEVFDSNVKDGSVRVEGTYSPGSGGEWFIRHEAYRSEDSGFGWIDPDVFGPGSARTRLLWPDQRFDRTVLGYRAPDVHWALADGLDFTAYRQSNERDFVTEVHVPMPGPPGAAVDVLSHNHTDLDSRGVRVEARKLAAGGVLVTYGVDLHEDRSQGTDTSTTTVSGLGPDQVRGRGGPQVPSARLRNVGAFGQAKVELGAATEVILGVRYQDVRARSLDTPGNAATPTTYRDRTVVGAVNVLRRVSERVNVVASLSRGFRTPNLVERFFVGMTPNGRGFWEEAPDLRPETSLNLEVGTRLRSRRLQAEVFAFQNTLTDGIVLEPTGVTEGRVVHYRNVNVDELRYRGVEAWASLALARGFSVAGDWTLLDVEDRRHPERVLAETYPNRAGASVRFDDPSGRLWARWGMRRNGARDALDGTTPVGDVIPAFTIHDVRAGIRLFGGHELTLAVENLTDVLYAEALNTGFFRPEPGRTFVATWGVRF